MSLLFKLEISKKLMSLVAITPVKLCSSLFLSVLQAHLQQVMPGAIVCVYATYQYKVVIRLKTEQCFSNKY